MNCLEEIVGNLELNENEKYIIICRFKDLHNRYKFFSNWYGLYFNYGRMFISFGSISVPALLSIDYMNNRDLIFWITWSISLLVSIINAYLALL